MTHDMQHPAPHSTPEQNLAFWDTRREQLLNQLVYATQMRVFFAAQVRALGTPEFGENISSLPNLDYDRPPEAA